jgi:Holliday junction resolvasome RuvABC endonuclease subunit
MRLTPSSKVLAIDPSLTCTGYAMFSADEQLICGGTIKVSPKLDTMERISLIIDDIRQLIEAGVSHVVVEVTSGKVSARHRGGGAGLATYGMLVGAVWYACSEEVETIHIYENTWTKGKGTKDDRRFRVAAEYPGRYDPEQDKGADVADAVLLGKWALENV